MVENTTDELYDKIQSLAYYGMCYNESLRLEPPVHISTSVTVNEDCKIGPYDIQKETQMFIDMGTLHKNPE